MVVACIGTSLSAYVYTWQFNQEVDEQIDKGKLPGGSGAAPAGESWRGRVATR